MTCVVTRLEHPRQRVSARVICWPLRLYQTAGISRSAGHFWPSGSLAVRVIPRTVTAEAAGSSPVVPATF